MSPDAIAMAVIVGGGATGAVIDMRVGRIPNAVTMSIAVVGAGLAAGGVGPVGIGTALAGCLLGLALMMPGYVFGATGAGDVKLLAAMGTLLGPATVFVGFLYALIAGAVIALFVAAIRGRVGHALMTTYVLLLSRGANIPTIKHPEAGNRFAYAPAIVAGAVLAALGN